MAANFQDVLRDVHDPDLHSLKTTASLSASTVYIGNPTLFAVVNTAAAGQASVVIDTGNKNIGSVSILGGGISLNAGVNNIGFATVSISNSVGNATLNPSPNYIGLTTTTLSTPTLFAVVNTSAAGVGNSIVTVANPNFGINAGVNNIGFATVTQVNQPALVASSAFIGIVTVANPSSFTGNVTLDRGSKTQLVDAAGSIVNAYNPDAGVNSLSVDLTSSGGALLNVQTAGDAKNFSVNGMAIVNVQHVFNGTDHDRLRNANIANATTGIGLLGVGSLGFDGTNYRRLITGTDGRIQGNVTVNNPLTIAAGVAGIGFATVNVAAIAAGANYVGLASVNIGGTLPALSAGVANIGFATVTTTNPSAFSGNVTITDGKTYIGLVTATVGNNPVLGAGVNGIGFATVNLVNLPALVASTANIGSVSVLGGTINSVLQTSTLNVGSVSVLGGVINVNLNAGVAGIGFATVNLVNQPALVASTANIGSVSVLGGTINANLQTGTLNIGSVSILGGGIGLNAGINGIGFATVANAIGTQFIGLVTAVTRNAGTNKTLLSLPVAMSTSSLATIAVPTTANTMYITNLLLNSDATVRVNILSGVTYLNGNASIGTTLNPGGGWVETGAPDSPTYIGNPSGAIVIQKFDMTGTSAKISGKIVYFQE